MTTEAETATKPVELHYTRTGDLIRCQLKNMTNHELREIMVGFWSRLDQEDRRDFILELVHYSDLMDEPMKHKNRHLSKIALAINTRGGNL